MSEITISKLAVAKILADPKFRASRQNKSTHLIPILRYYQRSYSTLNDGRLIEHGDGFMLSFGGEADIEEGRGIKFQAVTIAPGIDVIVGADDAMFSTPFNIGWSNAKFTFEPASQSQA